MRLITSKKIEGILEKLARLDVQTALFVNSEPVIDSNIAYLSGFSGMLNGVLVLHRDGMHLLTTALDYERALEQASVDEIVKMTEKETLGKVLKRLLPKAKKIGIVKDRFTLGTCAKLKIPKPRLVDIEKIMSAERAIKEEKEIEAIEKSAGISNKGVKFLQDFIQKGVKENEVAAELGRELLARGSECSPFDIIVSSGHRSSFVHPYPSSSNKKIGPGLGLVDFGAVYHGYVTDVTVPFLVGYVTKKEEAIVETVFSTYDEILLKIKDGVDIKSIYSIYKDRLRMGGFKIKHSLGHGIGLETHESPALNGLGGKLLENMTLALEPGVYVKGVGGCRLENDLVVTPSGSDVMTKSKLIRI